MKFPGKRKSKHYFPVNARDPLLQQIQPENESSVSWVVGIDQTLVDIEAKVDEAFIVRYGLSAGHSLVIEDDVAEALYQELVRNNLITHQFAGGTIGNTMHNYSVLADDRSVLLGVMCSNIEIGGYAYRYLCNTSSRTDLNYLQGVDGAIGRCFTLIGDSGERTFAISPGHMNKLRPESIPEAVIAGASALLHDITANNYHRNNVPNSSKHKCKWLTYSSLAQVCKYANRVSYQVLNQHSPRLTRGLPEREDSLEEAYWDR